MPPTWSAEPPEVVRQAVDGDLRITAPTAGSPLLDHPRQHVPAVAAGEHPQHVRDGEVRAWGLSQQGCNGDERAARRRDPERIGIGRATDRGVREQHEGLAADLIEPAGAVALDRLQRVPPVGALILGGWVEQIDILAERRACDNRRLP